MTADRLFRSRGEKIPQIGHVGMSTGVKQRDMTRYKRPILLTRYIMGWSDCQQIYLLHPGVCQLVRTGKCMHGVALKRLLLKALAENRRLLTKQPVIKNMQIFCMSAGPFTSSLDQES